MWGKIRPRQPYVSEQYIDDQFAQAQALWTQAGLLLERGPTQYRTVVPGMLDANGGYPGGLDNPFEVAALGDR